MPNPSEVVLLQLLSAHPGADLTVAEGAAFGDPLQDARELLLDDLYALPRDTPPRPLALGAGPSGFTIAPGGALGTPGHPLHLDALITFMVPDGGTIGGLLLVETDADGQIEDTFLVPLATLPADTPLRLIGVDRDGAAPALAAIGAASFAAGTNIALADGRQAPVETLSPGDRVLTRDAGPRPVLWTGRAIRRAAGPFAPIAIAAGTLNNERDLVLSPAHRLFVYQRSDRIGAGRAEVLVRAADLVDGAGITRTEGGFVEWVQILFESHQIVYAEGIAAESMLLDPATAASLPEGLAPPAHRAPAGFDLPGSAAGLPDLAARLRAASRGD
ncbi:MAG: Hint domain-containing protein [Hasllibacter sp.]